MSTPARVRRSAALALAIATASVSFAGCSVSPGDAVRVTMREWSITAEPQNVRSGRVRLEVDSIGEMSHTLALIRASDAAAIKLTPEGTIDLTAQRPIDEIEEFKPGQYLGVSPNLLAGDYVLVCTLTKGTDGQPLNHFAQGMHTKLTITARTKDDA